MKFWASLKITEQSLKNLKSEGVPDNVLEKLQGLKNQEDTGEGKFLDTLKTKIGDEQTVRFKSLILKHAKFCIGLLVTVGVSIMVISFSGHLPVLDSAHLLERLWYMFVVTGLTLNMNNLPRSTEENAQGIWINNPAGRGTAVQKQPETALKILSSAVDQTADHVFITDRDGVIVYVNPAFEKMTGYMREQALGKTPRILKSGQHDKSFFRMLWETVLSGKTFRAELINRKKNGELYYEEKSITPIRDHQGSITHFVSVGRDITKRKLLQGSLGRLLEQTSHIVSGLKEDQMYGEILRAAGMIAPADLATLSLLSDDSGQLHYVAAEGEQAERFFEREQVVARRSICSLAVREGGSVQIADMMNDPRVSSELAQTLGVKTGISLPLIKSGRVSGALTLLRRKRPFTEAESCSLPIFANYAARVIELAQLYEEVRRGKEHYRDFYENAPDGYITTDASGVIRAMNVTQLSWLGYDGKEVIGRLRLDDLVPRREYHSKEYHKVIHSLEQCIDGEFADTVELNLLRKDGSLLPARLNVSAIYDADRNNRGCRITVRDITKERDLEAQLLQAQKLQSLGTLVGGIAHDFNHILTGIMGFTELLRREVGPSGKLTEGLQHIELLSERAGDMVRQLLAFSRQRVSRKSTLALHPFLKESRKLLERTIPENIEIEMKLDSENVVIEADPTQIQQVLLNLAINARDAMPQGGRLIIETARVELDDTLRQAFPDLQPGSYMRLSLRDTGVGIAPDIQSRIFDPFYTTKEVGKGTGLGLSVVYGIVKNHGGEIKSESQVGRGTDMQVYLPLSSKAVVKETLPLVKPRQGSGTILLAEDEPTVLELAQAALEYFGYRVLTARNGLEAIAIYQNSKEDISLVILDIVMPKLGGWETLNELKRIDPTVKVLLTTGYDSSETIAKRNHLGGFLQKPYRADELALAVQEALQQDAMSNERSTVA